MFEFQMKAEPMHALENFIRFCVFLHRQIAAGTNERRGCHVISRMPNVDVTGDLRL